LAQNSKVLPFGFTEKHQFATKTDWNSIFFGCDSHILDRLYIIAMYRSFYVFQKNLNFGSKSKDVGLRYYRKMSICDKNWPKLHISWCWHLYSRSVIHNDYVYKFLWVLKKLNFGSKYKGVIRSLTDTDGGYNLGGVGFSHTIPWPSQPTVFNFHLRALPGLRLSVQ
jgi:hypothetical protein